MSACAVTSDLSRYIAETDRDMEREDAIWNKVAELHTDEAAIANALDELFQADPWIRDEKTGAFKNLGLSVLLAPYIAIRTKESDSSAISKIVERLEHHLYAAAEKIIDTERDGPGINVSDYRLNRDEREDAA